MSASGHSRHSGRSGPMSVLAPLATVKATCRKLTWEEIVAFYRLTLDQPAVNIKPSLSDVEPSLWLTTQSMANQSPPQIP
jgi:hypothetical protein